MKYMKKNKFLFITIIIITSIMVFFINQKKGFHEDEIFSYGSSNYKYDNVFRSFGYAEAIQDILYNQILKGNIIDIISNTVEYIKDNNYFEKDAQLAKEEPVFRTKEEALEYLAIDNIDIFNYFSVYYNQARDVHPPLFYFLVHFVSTFFYKEFSKYIIFIINILFFIGTLIMIKKILSLLKQDKLTIPTIILYGCSTGAISTVMFQRMYMLLTFFCVTYLYLTFKLIKNNFNFEKKWWMITIILGFLTQYYFCIYIVIIFTIISIYLLKNKDYKKWFNYLKTHIISAVIGVVIFPFSIYHIFFSYRGINSTEGHAKNMLENIDYYFSQIYKFFGLNNILLIIIILIIFTITYKIIKKQKAIYKNKILNLCILLIPIFIYILIVSKTSPFYGEDYSSRYIMCLFPIISISIIYICSIIYKKSLLIALILSITLSINGLINNTPVYLYKDNKYVLELAKQNEDKYFVYVYDNFFTHLSSLPEFLIYKESLIINANTNDFHILNNDKLNNSNEFILCIKNWLNQEEILTKILNSTNYTNIEVLLSIDKDIQSTYYKIKK